MMARAVRAALASLGLALLLGCPGEAPPSDPATRKTAPPLVAPLLSGGEFRLEEHRGKIVILDFWATWCAPCEVQMPVLDALWKHRDDDGLMIVGVSVDTDGPEKVDAWLKERGIGYPIALGSQQLAMDFDVFGFPTLFVLDRDGGIHTQHMGVLSRPELEEILESLGQG